MLRSIIHPARPVLGAAIIAAALFLGPADSEAYCPWDALATACYVTLPENSCRTGPVCDCRGVNIYYWPCNLTSCYTATPLPCGTDTNITGRGEGSDPVAADPGIALDAKPVPEALKIWNSPEMRAKRAAAVLLQRGASVEEFRAECLEDTQACQKAVRIPVSAEYSLKYVVDDSGEDQVIVSRGEEQVGVMKVPDEPPATD